MPYKPPLQDSTADSLYSLPGRFGSHMQIRDFIATGLQIFFLSKNLTQHNSDYLNATPASWMAHLTSSLSTMDAINL